MKKVIKISLAAAIAVFFFLNVNLDLNGNKVVALNANVVVRMAMAQSVPCYFDPAESKCLCFAIGDECETKCSDGCTKTNATREP